MKFDGDNTWFNQPFLFPKLVTKCFFLNNSVMVGPFGIKISNHLKSVGPGLIGKTFRMIILKLAQLRGFSPPSLKREGYKERSNGRIKTGSSQIDKKIIASRPFTTNHYL